MTPKKGDRTEYLEGRTEDLNKRGVHWINQIDLRMLDNLLWPHYIAYICLNFLDLYTTTIATGSTQVFREDNILASRLFSMELGGFFLALIIKYAPAFPLFMQCSYQIPLQLTNSKFDW